MNCKLDEVDCVVKERPSRSHLPMPARIERSVSFQEVSTTAPSHRALQKPRRGVADFAAPSKNATAPVEQSTAFECFEMALGLATPAKDTMPDDLKATSNGPSLYRENCAMSQDMCSQADVSETNEVSSPPREEEEKPLDIAVGDSEGPSCNPVQVRCTQYPFIRVNRTEQMPVDDLEFLEAQGCFSLPPRPLLDPFIRTYFLYVHPNVPLLDEADFWDMYTRPDISSVEINRISLFLLRAMLFASCTFVPLDIIYECGFSSTRDACAGLHRRTKLLFDFECERDSIAIAQGALLLAYHSPYGHNIKINSFWLGLAIQYAKDADAHRYQVCARMTSHQRKLCKRLWWCCIIRDRILPLGCRRPLSITPDQFDFGTPTLTVEDFEDEICCSKVYDPATKRLLAHVIAAMCELAISLTEVIMIVYPPCMADASGSIEETEFLRSVLRIEQCKSGLTRWFDRATIGFPTPAGSDHTHKSVILYTNLMYIYYHSARLALSQHEALLSAMRSTPCNHYPVRFLNTRLELQEAAAGITENLKELMQLNLAKYLPISAVAYAALPLALHALDVKLSSSTSQTAIKQRRLDIFLAAMKVWQTQYSGADQVSENIAKVIGLLEFEGLENYRRGHGSIFDSTDSASTASASSALQRRPPSKVAEVRDWGDVFVGQPGCYLRLVLTLDLAMSRGKYPDESDLPRVLQSSARIRTKIPLYTVPSRLGESLDRSDTSPYRSFLQPKTEKIEGESTNGLVKVNKAFGPWREMSLTPAEETAQMSPSSPFNLSRSDVEMQGVHAELEHFSTWLDDMLASPAA